MKKIIKQAISALMSLVVVLALFPHVDAAGDGSGTDRRIIVAMGDSYSSGEGIEPFFFNKDDWLAHRSKKAWSGILELPDSKGSIRRMSDYHWNKSNTETASWFFVAASGAKTFHVDGGYDRNGKWEDGNQEKSYNQFNIFSGTEELKKQINVIDDLVQNGNKIDYVTMTMGGNDVGFEEIMETAALDCDFLTGNLTQMIDEAKRYIREPRYTSGVIGSVETDGLKIKLSNLYRLIWNRTEKNTTILVAGYPKLVFSNMEALSRIPTSETVINKFIYMEREWITIDSDERVILNDAVKYFNSQIAEAVSDCQEEGMDIWFISVEEEFKDHEPGTWKPYLNGVKLARTSDLNNMPGLSAYSFHPNEEGAKAYARCVQAKIDDLEGIKRDPTTGEVISIAGKTPVSTPGHTSQYEVFDGIADTWEAAEQYCESLGGHLATISSQKENDMVYQLMRDAGYSSAYFGLTDRDQEGTWKWVTGEPDEYWNWAKSEPNSENPNEDYAMFYFKFTDGTWNDGDFGGRTASGGTAFVCEWDTEEAYQTYLNTRNQTDVVESNSGIILFLNKKLT